MFDYIACFFKSSSNIASGSIRNLSSFIYIYIHDCLNHDDLNRPLNPTLDGRNPAPPGMYETL